MTPNGAEKAGKCSGRAAATAEAKPEKEEGSVFLPSVEEGSSSSSGDAVCVCVYSHQNAFARTVAGKVELGRARICPSAALAEQGSCYEHGVPERESQRVHIHQERQQASEHPLYIYWSLRQPMSRQTYRAQSQQSRRRSSPAAASCYCRSFNSETPSTRDLFGCAHRTTCKSSSSSSSSSHSFHFDRKHNHQHQHCRSSSRSRRRCRCRR